MRNSWIIVVDIWPQNRELRHGVDIVTGLMLGIFGSSKHDKKDAGAKFPATNLAILL